MAYEDFMRYYLGEMNEYRKYLVIKVQLFSGSVIINDSCNLLCLLCMGPSCRVGAKLQGWGQAAGYQPRPQAGG